MLLLHKFYVRRPFTISIPLTVSGFRVWTEIVNVDEFMNVSPSADLIVYLSHIYM